MYTDASSRARMLQIFGYRMPFARWYVCRMICVPDDVCWMILCQMICVPDDMYAGCDALSTLFYVFRNYHSHGSASISINKRPNETRLSEAIILSTLTIINHVQFDPQKIILKFGKIPLEWRHCFLIGSSVGAFRNATWKIERKDEKPFWHS